MLPAGSWLLRIWLVRSHCTSSAETCPAVSRLSVVPTRVLEDIGADLLHKLDSRHVQYFGGVAISVMYFNRAGDRLFFQF